MPSHVIQLRYTSDDPPPFACEQIDKEEDQYWEKNGIM